MDEFEQDHSGSSKIGQIIGIIICFILIVGLSFGLIFLSHEARQFNNDIAKVQKNIKDVEDSIEMKQAEINTLNSKLNENINIDELINEQKDTYLSLANELEQKIIVDDIDAKIAYLIFVDGPFKLTNQILDTLDEYNTKATFFCLEKDSKYEYEDEVFEIYDDIFKRIIKDGHTLGNDSTPELIEMSLEDTYDDVDYYINGIIENRDFIKDQYGYTTSIMRFKDDLDLIGDNKDELIEKLNNEHYGYVDCNCITGDDESLIDSDQIITNVLENTNNRKILTVLMHDNNINTLEALPYIIEGLQEQGYTLLPLIYNSIMVKNK